jgi:ATP-binding cassette subfamily B protein/subfamily B ATP-binding cassette protein MsbA
VLAVLLVKIGFDLLKPWPMKVLVDYVLNGDPVPPRLAAALAWLPGAATREGLLAWCVLATLVLFLAGWALGVLGAFASIAFGQRMVFDLAADLFAHLQRMSLRFHARRSVGDLIRRVTGDCGFVSIIVKDALLPAFAAVFTLVSVFLVMWRIDWALTLLSMSVLPLMVVAFRAYARPMEQRARVQDDADGRVYEVVEQTLSAVPVVQAFGRADDADLRFGRATSDTLAATLAVTDVQLRFKILVSLATAVGTATILWVGTHRALDGAVTVGSMLVFLSYLGSLYEPLNTMMYSSSTLSEASGGAGRVFEILHADREVSDAPGAAPLPKVRGHLRLEGVTFGYDPDRPVLNDVTLEARPGETVAVIGPTGAGKSTLVGLIPRFFDPWAGRVTIDGHDVRDVQLASLRRQVSVVLQEPFLFPVSLAENIAYGRPDATREQVEAAATAANAHAFISRLPQGYDTIVGERGATLSGGERQRVSIARALLKDAPVLVLDEPTSALDGETEQLLLRALERLMEGRTTFIIAHRLSTIRNADRIVSLEGGRVVEQGTPADLLAAGGLYRRLLDASLGIEATSPDSPRSA